MSKANDAKFVKRVTALSLAVCMTVTCSDWSAVAQAAGEKKSALIEEDIASSYIYVEPDNISKTELKDKRTKDLWLINGRSSGIRVKRGKKVPDRIKIHGSKFIPGIGHRMKSFELRWLEQSHSFRNKMLVFSMSIPVFQHEWHLRKKILLTKGEALNFGAFVTPFLKKYSKNMQKH